jgi:hypothetical protein
MTGRDFATRHMLFHLIIKGLSATASGSDGSRLTELQPEKTGTTSREILFPRKLGNMPRSIVWWGAAKTAETDLHL